MVYIEMEFLQYYIGQGNTKKRVLIQMVLTSTLTSQFNLKLLL